jgi:hypothetical protein
MEYALAAIAALAGLAALGWWCFAISRQLVGELLSENKILRKGVEAHDRADRILAGPVASGGRLRARLLAHADRYELPESDPNGQASASTVAERRGDS